MIATGQNLLGVYDSYAPGGPVDKTWYWISFAALAQFVLALFPSLESFKFVSILGAVMSMFYRYGSVSECGNRAHLRFSSFFLMAYAHSQSLRTGCALGDRVRECAYVYRLLHACTSVDDLCRDR